MRIQWTNRAGEQQHRAILIGTTSLRGMRIDEFILDDQHEARKLFSEDGIKWAAYCLIPAMKVKPIDNSSGQ